MSTSILALPSQDGKPEAAGGTSRCPGRQPVTAYRVTIGICRAFRALVLTVSGIVELLAGGYVAGLLCLMSAS